MLENNVGKSSNYWKILNKILLLKMKVK